MPFSRLKTRETGWCITTGSVVGPRLHRSETSPIARYLDARSLQQSSRLAYNTHAESAFTITSFR